MEHKLPYYMAYQMDLKEYGEEKRDRRDVEYMKSMYPMSAKKILPYVEEECDRMEYEGSMIYDEYPDRLLLYLMAGRIYDRMKEGEKKEIAMEIEKEQVETQELKRKKKDREETLMDLVQILLYQEIVQRRCRHRRNCRHYY
ncbi:hypothetical protein [Sellimonas catena]|uniref:Uncharacterized protein n=1 Tax=Sellimonas catena TaxID=2994035 RepID=A0A9W6C9K6_9FIRM|nr:hypothetical protein [Sellimonas catena]GLG88575.1 hypothetical protein Selli2_00010 [Sellimonas catena]